MGMMLDSYSLDRDFDGLDQQYQAHYDAYFRIFNRCGLSVVAVRSDTGMMGGKMAHEYMYLTPIGEDSLLFCDGCGYSANRQVAAFAKPAPEPESALPVEKIATLPSSFSRRNRLTASIMRRRPRRFSSLPNSRTTKRRPNTRNSYSPWCVATWK